MGLPERLRSRSPSYSQGMRLCQAFTFGGAAALFGLEAKRSQDVGLRLLKGSNGIESTVSDPPEFFIFFR